MVTGATSITISTTWTDSGVDAGEGIILQRSLTGGAGTWTTVRTFDGGATGSGTYNDTFAWTPTDNTIFIRYRSFGTYDGGGEDAFIDDVDITFNAPANAVGTQVVRTANLTGVTSPSLTFSTTDVNLETSDDLVVEVATSPAGPFTVLATYDSATANGPKGPFDLTAYRSANTAIRFRVINNFQVNDEVFTIDDVNISWTGLTTFAANPPEMVSASRGCRIQPGQSMTVSFAVTADNPFPVGQFASGMAADLSPTAHFLVRLRVSHPLNAALGGVYLLVLTGFVAQTRGHGSDGAHARRWAIAVAALVVAQLAIGLLNLWLLAPVWMQLVHLVAADLLWIAFVLLADAASRTRPRAGEPLLGTTEASR